MDHTVVMPDVILLEPRTWADAEVTHQAPVPVNDTNKE